MTTISEFKRSASSIWWRCEASYSEHIYNDENMLEIRDSLGGRLSFDLLTGEFEYDPDWQKHLNTKQEC